MALMVVELNGWGRIVLFLVLCFYVKKEVVVVRREKLGKDSRCETVFLLGKQPQFDDIDMQCKLVYDRLKIPEPRQAEQPRNSHRAR